MVPFLKWPGGKRWLIAHYAKLFPQTYARYREPFLGGASVFFYLEPKNAVLSDTNSELIETYSAVKNNWRTVRRILGIHESNHDGSYYYRVRDSQPVTPAGRAARFIYLNRTCFNGIYRVNRDGDFNVPKGTKSSVVLSTDDFEAAAQLLCGTVLDDFDFEKSIDAAERDDLIFADPPYTVRHNNNGFIKYNEVLFSWKDQIRLVAALARARDRGAKIVATNANHAPLKRLYLDQGFFVRTVTRFTSISGEATSRGSFEEMIVLTEKPR